MINFSYGDVHLLAEELAVKVKKENPDYVVAVSRGGLVPGVILSHLLNLPLEPIKWSTRDFAYQSDCIHIADDVRNGARVLLVDDINDSGKTFIDILSNWGYNSESKGKVVTASIFQRSTTAQSSDYYGKLIDNDDWVGFPWERLYE